MNHLLRLFVLLFLSNTMLAQNEVKITPEQANASYFEFPRETLYLHLNKDTYLAGEEIWFKGYAYDQQSQRPSFNTTNFNVELFDEQGKEVYDGLFLGYEGSMKGNIKVDSTLTSGTYYLRVSTNWMNNFLEDESYTKRINIINGVAKDETTKKIQYDFQLLPEGGHLVADTKNTVGFKLINTTGRSVAFTEGSIVDDQGKTITTFSSNAFGIGKFCITPRQGVRYRARIAFNKRAIETLLPKAKSKGIAMTLNNLFEEYLAIEFNTNPNTLKEIVKKDYELMIRQNHQSKKVKVKFMSNQTKKEVAIDRAKLYSGVNTITLFQDNTPILERLVYNEIKTQEYNDNFNLVVESRENDSLTIAISTSTDPKLNFDMSVSVLPTNTKSYNPEDDIRSALWLKPYLKGYVENSKYYFHQVDRKKRYDLDLLLITQGWSKYSWNNIFNYNSIPQYEFNQGFKVVGKFQNVKEDIRQAYIFPTKNSGSRIIDLKEDNSFQIDNFFPEKNEKIRVAAVMPDGSFVKNGMYLQLQSNRFKKSFSQSVSLSMNTEELGLPNIQIPQEFFSDEVELLEEVVIQGKTKKHIRERSRIPKYFLQNSVEITKELVFMHFSVLDYIESTKKFIVFRDNPSNVFIRARRPVSVRGPVSPILFIDDIPYEDFGILWGYNLIDVERIYMDQIGYGVGGRGLAGSIRIYTRREPLEYFKKPEGVDKVSSYYVAKRGFEPTKEYYNPGYSNYLDPLFVDYGAIHWQPNLQFDRSGTGRFKIPDTGLENIQFFVEGMASDGSLISKQHILKNINPN
ncbi:hypothetical protein [Aquimarina spongiae]|uniref:MG2 domain-containing protein n=1 Tax=Aquimarina spongiae TaxID=570521 RepID=A0A1M6FB94_9FLAO|nr:hypothetical protein [Aquimarina spongiae]SHI94943.1 hypothetical protein SAMN04488508_104187 [Aquimarina spongiae]